MKPRLSGLAVCLILLACSVPVIVRAQDGAPVSSSFSAVGSDPSELYYHAWKMCDEGERLAKKQQYVEAIHKIKDASTIISAIARDHPQWRTSMVARRQKLLQDNLSSWTALAKEQAAKQGKEAEQHAAEQGGAQRVRGIPSFEELEAQRRAQSGAQRRLNSESNRQPYVPISPASAEVAGSSYERLEHENMRLKLENEALINALKETKQELLIATKQKVLAEAGEKALQERYNELEAQLKQERNFNNELVRSLTKQLDSTKKELEESKTARQKAEDQVAHLTQQLEQSQEMLAEVTQDRDALRKERDQLAAIIELNSPEKTKNLLDTNLSLAARLKEAEAKIAQLENEKQQSEDMRAVNLKELEATRAEVAQLKVRLAAMFDENIGYRRRISELNTKLVNTEAELEKLAASPKADPLDIEENRILRSAVNKQMRLLATQVKSRELLIESYTRLKLKDPKMAEALTMLNDESKLKLTPEEEELLATIDKRNKEQRREEEAEALKLASDQDRLRQETELAIKRQYEMEAMGQAAEKAFNKGRYAAAEQLYKTLLDSKPDHFAGRVNLGAILLKRRLVDEAIIHLKRAVEIDKDSAPAQFLLGIARYSSGRYKEATESFTETVRIEPDNATALLYLGNIESLYNNTDKAVSYYEQAVKVNPAFADAYFNMAATLAKGGKFKEARVSYDKAINAGALPDPELQKALAEGTALPVIQPVIANTPEPEADGSSQPSGDGLQVTNPVTHNQPVVAIQSPQPAAQAVAPQEPDPSKNQDDKKEDATPDVPQPESKQEAKPKPESKQEEQKQEAKPASRESSGKKEEQPVKPKTTSSSSPKNSGKSTESKNSSSSSTSTGSKTSGHSGTSGKKSSPSTEKAVPQPAPATKNNDPFVNRKRRGRFF